MTKLSQVEPELGTAQPQLVGFFCLLVLNSVPIGAVAVMTSEKQVRVLLALSSPLVGAGYETTLNQISED